MSNPAKLFIAIVLTISMLLIALVHVVQQNLALTTYQSPSPIDLFSAVSTDFPSGTAHGSTTINERDLYCLALNIYHEAASEKRLGKDAVAHVTLNRVSHPRFNNSVCNVVYAGQHYRTANGNYLPVKNKCQFSWYCDGKPDQLNLVHADGKPNFINIKAWEESIQAAQDALLGITVDPTKGATHYFNPRLANPAWQHALTKTTVIYNHQFHVDDV